MAKEYALDDRAQLHKDANQSLDENLAPDEPIRLIILGNSHSAMIGTDRRVFVFKKGWLAGAMFGKKVTSWDYRNIAGIQIETGKLTGSVTIQAPGVESVDTNYYSQAKNSPHNAPNAIPLNGKFDQARRGVALIRQLISESHQRESQSKTSDTLDVAGQIRQLAELRDQGTLTDQEFETTKTALLARL